MLHNELKDISNRIKILDKEIDKLVGGVVYKRLKDIDNATFFSWNYLEKYLLDMREKKDDTPLLAGIKVAFKHLENDINKHKLAVDVADEGSKSSNVGVKLSCYIGSFFIKENLKNLNDHLRLIKSCIEELERRQNIFQHGLLSLTKKIGLK